MNECHERSAGPSTTILLLRHAQSTWNAAERWQGWADPPLSPLGEAQAARAGRRLAALWDGTAAAFDALVTSDLTRATRTAQLVAAAAGWEIPHHQRADLREYDIGRWSGLRSADIEARWPGQIASWQARRQPAPPGGESWDTFERRVGRVLAALHRAHSGGRVLVIAHSGVVRAARRPGQGPPVSALSGGWLPSAGRGGAGAVDLLSEPAPRSAPPG